MLRDSEADINSGNWLYFPTVRERANFRLICFPPAGIGAAYFRNWARDLPTDVEICAVKLPGKTIRFKEPPVLSISRMAESIVDAIRQLPELRSVFFGHSMGAILASETVRLLMALSLPLPRHLVVSGRRPPHFRDPTPTIGDLPEADFIREIGRRYGGIPAEILENPDVLALVLPGLRADIIALERFQPDPRPPLPTPISAFGGDADAMTPVTQLEAWRLETRAAFAMRVFPGGHFYLDAQRAEVLREISRIVAGIEDET